MKNNNALRPIDIDKLEQPHDGWSVKRARAHLDNRSATANIRTEGRMLTQARHELKDSSRRTLWWARRRLRRVRAPSPRRAMLNCSRPLPIMFRKFVELGAHTVGVKGPTFCSVSER